MLKTAASKVSGVGRTAAIVFVLAAVLAGCSGETAGSGDEAAPAAAPEAKDNHATTVEGREVMIGMVANDTGESLRIDGFEPGERTATSSARPGSRRAASSITPTRLQWASPARTNSCTR
jgi:hypothetical protein